jgi:hypothetical protein
LRLPYLLRKLLHLPAHAYYYAYSTSMTLRAHQTSSNYHSKMEGREGKGRERRGEERARHVPHEEGVR